MPERSPDCLPNGCSLLVASKLSSNIIRQKNFDIQDLAGGTASLHMQLVKTDEGEEDISDLTIQWLAGFNQKSQSFYVLPRMVRTNKGISRHINFNLLRTNDVTKQRMMVEALWEGVTDEEKRMLAGEQIEILERGTQQTLEYYSSIDRHRNERSREVESQLRVARGKVKDILDGDSGVEGVTLEEETFLRKASSDGIAGFIEKKANIFADECLKERRDAATSKVAELSKIKRAIECKAVVFKISDSDAALEIRIL